MTTKQDCFRFMDLPGEIRMLIYQKYLVEKIVWVFYTCNPKKPWDYSTKNRVTSSPRYSPSTQPRNSITSLFLCNKAIHSEASFVFYNQNTFRFWVGKQTPGWSCLYKWLLQIGPTNRTFIERIHIGYNYIHDLLKDAWPPTRPIRPEISDYHLSRYVLFPRAPQTGWKETISPNIKHVFELLATRADGSSHLRVTMAIPGSAILNSHIRCPENSGEEKDERVKLDIPKSSGSDNYAIRISWADEMDYDQELARTASLSLPEYLETCRKLNTGDSVSIHWQADEWPEGLEERRKCLEANGWEVLSIKPKDGGGKFPTVEVTANKRDI